MSAMTTLVQMFPIQSDAPKEHTMRLGGGAQAPAIIVQANDSENVTVTISSFPSAEDSPLQVLDTAVTYLEQTAENLRTIVDLQKAKDGQDLERVKESEAEEWCESCQAHHAPGERPKPAFTEDSPPSGRLVTTDGVVMDGEGVPGEEFKELTPDLLGILTGLIDELPINDEAKVEMRKTLGQVQGINLPVTYLSREELEADARANPDDMRMPLSPDETEEVYWADVQHAHVGERMAFGMGFQVGVTTGRNVTNGKLPVRARRTEKE